VHVLLLARHGQSKLNAAGLVSGDPRLDPGLSDQGIEEGLGRLGSQISAIAIDVFASCRIPARTAKQPASRSASSRASTLRIVDPELGDVRIGDLEGQPLQAYRGLEARPSPRTRRSRAARASTTRRADYASRLRAPASKRHEETIFCVCHEIPVRYAVKRCSRLGGPRSADSRPSANAAPYVFDAAGLRPRVVGIPRAPELTRAVFGLRHYADERTRDRRVATARGRGSRAHGARRPACRARPRDRNRSQPGRGDRRLLCELPRRGRTARVGGHPMREQTSSVATTS